MKKIKILKFSLTIILAATLAACTGEPMKIEMTNGAATTSQSTMVFAGITSADQVTDISARLNWTHNPSAVAYDVFEIISGSPVYHSTVQAPTAEATISDLTPSTSYTYRVVARDQELLSDTNTVDVSITTNATPGCPSEYIRVPFNAAVGTTSDFCVMKYEARVVLGVATSTNIGNPYQNVMRDGILYCRALGAGYSLMTNEEYMTIARNIESRDDNWSNGTVGDGYLSRGWSANAAFGDTWSNTSFAPVTDATCLYNSAANTCAATGDPLYKRTHNLTNGEIIWDFAGNVWEWVDWVVNNAYKPFVTADVSPVTAYREYKLLDNRITNTNIKMLPNSWQANDLTLDSTHGIGMYLGGTSQVAPTSRGGRFNSGKGAGIYTINQDGSGTDQGFRCVYR